MAAVAEEQELWLARSSADSDAAHQELFFRYAPWARAVARDVYRRVRVPQAEWGDYAHDATVGLLEAMSRFDASRGIDFVGFAKSRVRGAVFTGLRVYLAEYGRRDSGSHRYLDRLASFDGHSDDPLEQLVATVTGLGLGLLLDASVSEELFGSEPDASTVAQCHQMDRLLEAAMAGLQDRERLVISLHYRQHIPFVEIAKLLQLTKGRISQIHKSAVERMRTSVRTPLVEAKRA